PRARGRRLPPRPAQHLHPALARGRRLHRRDAADVPRLGELRPVARLRPDLPARLPGAGGNDAHLPQSLGPGPEAGPGRIRVRRRLRRVRRERQEPGPPRAPGHRPDRAGQRPCPVRRPGPRGTGARGGAGPGGAPRLDGGAATARPDALPARHLPGVGMVAAGDAGARVPASGGCGRSPARHHRRRRRRARRRGPRGGSLEPASLVAGRLAAAHRLEGDRAQRQRGTAGQAVRRRRGGRAAPRLRRPAAVARRRIATLAPGSLGARGRAVDPALRPAPAGPGARSRCGTGAPGGVSRGAGPAWRRAPPGRAAVNGRRDRVGDAGAAARPWTAPRLGWSLKALGGTLGGQWERTRRDTLFLMGAVFLSAPPQFAFQPAWVSATFLLLFFWRFGLVISGRWTPRTSVRLVAAIGCAAGVYAQHHSLIGRDPGTSLLVLFLGLKLMEMQARRDLFVVIFLCFFLLLTTFFHSQSSLVATMVLLAVFALVSAMLTIQFAENEVAIGRRMRMTAKLMLQAAPLAVVLFFVFPRLSAPLWGTEGLAGAARTGLSETMAPGSIAELSQSDEVAFRVQFDSSPARRFMYWRGPVLDHFDGRAWSTSRVLPHPSVPASVEVPADGPRHRYSVTLEPTGQRWLFALE